MANKNIVSKKNKITQAPGQTCGHSSWAMTTRGCLDCQKANYIR